MIVVPLVAVALAVAAGVTVDQTSDCLDEDALARDLQALLPAQVDLQALDVRVGVHDALAEGRLAVSLDVEGAEPPPLARAFEIAPGDCAALPRLLARVVARHFAPPARPGAEGSAGVGAPPVEAARPRVIEDRPRALVDAGAPFVTPAPALVLRPHAGVGVGAGVVPLLADGRFELGLTFGDRELVALHAFARAALSQPIAIGAGQAQLANGVLGLGAAGNVGLGAYALVPRAVLLGGATVAWGTGFRTDEVVVLPHLGALASLSLWTPLGIFVDVGAEGVLTPAVLATRDGARVQTSFVTLYAQVGFAFDVPLSIP